MRGFFWRIVIYLGLIAGAPRLSAGDPGCTPLNTDIPVRSTLASAGFFANLRHADNSISYLTDQLMSESEARAKQVASAEGGCSRSCSNPTTAILFTSTPYMTLSDYNDAASCTQLLKTTTREPIEYRNRVFDSREDAEDWYDDLSQGDGPDGEDLYSRCPGQCSPMYSSVAYIHRGKFILSTTIICGHARDKDDNQYRLTASIRWICPGDTPS